MPRRQTRSAVGSRFGTTLRRLRNDRGLSQEALAERADLAADYLGFIERGDNVPTLIVVLKLARALEIDASELVAEFTYAALRKLEL